MTSVLARIPQAPDFASLRVAGNDALSLALIETRNRTLRWVAALEAAAVDSDAMPLIGTLGRIAWFQERWTARNVQRSRGERADLKVPCLAPLLAGVDDAFDPAFADPLQRRFNVDAVLPDLAAARTLAVDTLELTLDLLAAAVDGDRDDALYFFRVALFEEALQEERFAEHAQAVGVDAGLVPRPAALAPRPPIAMPSTRWLLGVQPPGFVFDDQQPAHDVSLPEFEIDAQPVSWAQYAEFVEDGGYDDAQHWDVAGKAWLEREGRRVPRFVEQMRHGVVQCRFGRESRLPLHNAVVHVTCHEAEAWCRWAGRRLPAEVEWEAAAHQGATRGFRGGEVREWTASTYRGWPGFVAAPWRDGSTGASDGARALRGESVATSPALVGPRIRGHGRLDDDGRFVGFRSCAP